MFSYNPDFQNFQKIKTLNGNHFSNKATLYRGSEADLKATMLSLALKIHLVTMW